MANVKLDHVRKEFPDGTVAVHDFTLSIEDGEFLTFLGPSGCGKTTTLRMIAGLETLSGGAIQFGSRRVDDMPPGERNVAMVFQSYALYPHMTVRGNLEYPLRKRRVPEAERDRRIAETAATLKIESLLDRRPRQLSGGQQQRVALGRAIIRNPEVFLLDEPLSNLDATLRAHLRAELIQLHRRIGKTMIYVTHDQVEAMAMSTRIAVMHQGRLQQVDTPDRIYNQPANRIVAAFVGTPAMNFIEGELVDDGGALLFRAPSLAVRVPDDRTASLREVRRRGTVVAGIRPEDVLMDGDACQARIRIVEPLGHESIVILDVGIATLVARAAADLPLRAEQSATIGLRPSKIHFFDAETGVRLPG
jgi:multiple sugar transport system ATP-binding protein